MNSDKDIPLAEEGGRIQDNKQDFIHPFLRLAVHSHIAAWNISNDEVGVWYIVGRPVTMFMNAAMSNAIELNFFTSISMVWARGIRSMGLNFLK